jgi:hypothetical protein
MAVMMFNTRRRAQRLDQVIVRVPCDEEDWDDPQSVQWCKGKS